MVTQAEEYGASSCGLFSCLGCLFLLLWCFGISDFNENYPKAMQRELHVRPNLFQTAEEAQKSMAEEVTAPEHVPLSKFQVGGILIFFCVVILEFWLREKFNTSLDVLVSATSASELPDDLCCPITTELMSEPVVCVGDGKAACMSQQGR